MLNILLIALLLLQTGGMLLYYQYRQHTVQSMMQDKLTDEQQVFEVITLPMAQYQKALKIDGEILIDGKRYDVKSTIAASDKVTLVALRDKLEEEIAEDIEHTVRKNNNKNKTQQSLLDLLSLDYLPSYPQSLGFACVGFKTMYGQGDMRLQSRPPDRNSPPPRAV